MVTNIIFSFRPLHLMDCALLSITAHKASRTYVQLCIIYYMMLMKTCCSCCRCCSCSSSSSNSCCSSSRLTTSLNISQSKTIFFDGTSDFEALALGRPGLDRLMSSTGQVGDSASWRGGGLGGAQRQIVHLIVHHCFWYKHICGGGRRSKAHDC